ncbi:hypothetical protein [Pontibacter roseus]|uniref:hypothetical protein n=1 Tax=Pontibacter roseus TaxID=336989 RepID=UPI0012F753FD|nr:hypothetical protein [Pontibacter roseus]
MERYDRDNYGNGQHENRYRDDYGYHNDRDMRNSFEHDYRQHHNHQQQEHHHLHHDDRFGRYQSHPDDSRGREYASDFRRGQPNQGDLRRGYGISGYDGISDRFNTLNNPDNARDYGENDTYYGGSRDGFTGTRFGGGIGEAFPSSHHGVPDTTYGLRNFHDDEGTGMGSSYGGSNYGGGTGYGGGHRGGSFGSTQYGSSSGNYGGSGSMSGSRNSLSDRTSHNSDRGTTEYGGF